MRTFLSSSSRRLLAATVAVSASAVPLVALAAVPTGWTQLAAVDGGTSALGSSIATTGSAAIVGAPFATATSGGAATGAVFVYTNDAGVWSSEKVTAPTPIDGGNFGTSVAASGDLIAVGAAGTPPTAYVFQAQAGTYEAALTIADPKTDKNASFGGSVAVHAGADANYVAVAAPPGSASATGLVFVSRQPSGGAWSTTPASISDPSAEAFGIAVAFAGNGDLLVGDPGTGAGQVLVYAPEADGGWSSVGTLPFALDGGTVQQFGNGIAAYDDRVVVTAPESADTAGTYNGAAFVFVANDAGVWTQEAVLTGATGETFGESAPAIGDGMIAIGSAKETPSAGFGQVDVWVQSGGAWVPVPASTLTGDSYYGQAAGVVAGDVFIGDTSALGAASISDVTSTLIIEAPMVADGGQTPDATVGEGDASAQGDGGGAAPGEDGAVVTLLDGATSPSGDGGGETGGSSSSGCSCTSAGGGGGVGLLGMAAQGALVLLAWSRRRRSR